MFWKGSLLKYLLGVASPDVTLNSPNWLNLRYCHIFLPWAPSRFYIVGHLGLGQNVARPKSNPQPDTGVVHDICTYLLWQAARRLRYVNDKYDSISMTANPLGPSARRKSFLWVKNSQHFSDSDLSTNHGGQYPLVHCSPHGCLPLPGVRLRIGPKRSNIQRTPFNLNMLCSNNVAYVQL